MSNDIDGWLEADYEDRTYVESDDDWDDEPTDEPTDDELFGDEDHGDHDTWPLLSKPGTTWCRTCQVHVEDEYDVFPADDPAEAGDPARERPEEYWLPIFPWKRH